MQSNDFMALLFAYFNDAKRGNKVGTINFEEFLDSMEPAIDIFMHHQEDLYDEEPNLRWEKDLNRFQELKSSIAHQKKVFAKEDYKSELLNLFSPLNRIDSPRYQPWRKADFKDPGVPESVSDITPKKSKKRKANTQNPTANGKFKKNKTLAFGKLSVNPPNAKKIESRQWNDAEKFKNDLKKKYAVSSVTVGRVDNVSVSKMVKTLNFYKSVFYEILKEAIPLMYNMDLTLDNFIHIYSGKGKEYVGESNLVRSILVAIQNHFSKKPKKSGFENVNHVYTVMNSILKTLHVEPPKDLISNVHVDTLKDLADQIVTTISGLYLGKILDLQEKLKSLGSDYADIADFIMNNFKNGRDKFIIERYLTMLQYAPRGPSFCPGTPVKDSFVLLSESTLIQLLSKGNK